MEEPTAGSGKNDDASDATTTEVALGRATMTLTLPPKTASKVLHAMQMIMDLALIVAIGVAVYFAYTSTTQPARTGSLSMIPVSVMVVVTLFGAIFMRSIKVAHGVRRR